jgi:hypothetical protein
MTHEKLLGYTSAELKAMTTTDLERIYAGVLSITRPDRATKPVSTAKTGQPASLKQKQHETMDMLKSFGIDLDL